MQKLYALGLVLLFTIPLVSCEDDDEVRDPKLISTFQIVRFPNDPCVGSNSVNGTCYTSQECSDKSGTSAGSCADGFGVCCTFIIDTCGSTTSENLTQWKNPSTITAGNCDLTVMPIDDSICSIRLDLTAFVITGPSSDTSARIRRKFGHPFQDLGDTDYGETGSALTGSCLTDTFSATSASISSSPPTICGSAKGEHMYLEADVDRGNYLTFYIADAAASSVTAYPKGVTTLATRSWQIEITQIECTSKTLPPVGCTKYYYNAAGVAQLKSSNWQQSSSTTFGIHLGMQHDRYCIRRERSMCVGCFAAADTNFAVSGRYIAGTAATQANYVVPYGCCGYSTMASLEAVGTQANNLVDGTNSGDAIAADFYDKGLTQWGWDCVIIPGAYVQTADDFSVETVSAEASLKQVLAESPTANIHPIPSGPQICGHSKGLGPGIDELDTSHGWAQDNARLLSLGFSVNLTVCSRQTPFVLEFMSDDLEGVGGGTTAGQSEQMATDGRMSLGFNINFKQFGC